MADIRFDCPNCAQSLETQPNMAGQLVDCPNCKNAIEVPYKSKSLTQAVATPPPLSQSPIVRPCPFCAEEILASAVKCKHCGEFLDGRRLQAQPAIKAKITRKSEVAGEGCLIQGVGLVVIPAGLFFGWGTGLAVSIPLGLVLLLIGSRKASYPVCSNCGMKLTGTKINLCPACKADFK